MQTGPHACTLTLEMTASVHVIAVIGAEFWEGAERRKFRILESAIHRMALTCDSAALAQLSKQPRCPKVLSEGAKGVFGPPGRDSQNSLLHGAKPIFGSFPRCVTG